MPYCDLKYSFASLSCVLKYQVANNTGKRFALLKVSSHSEGRPSKPAPNPTRPASAAIASPATSACGKPTPVLTVTFKPARRKGQATCTSRRNSRRGPRALETSKGHHLRPLTMRYFRSLPPLLAVSLAGLIFSTSRAGTADAASITLEPSVPNSDSTFVITSTLRVSNITTHESYGNSFPIDLYSSYSIEFVLRPPPGAEEMWLSSSAPGEAIEVIFRASLVDGPNVDKCLNANADADSEENAFDQLLIGAFFKASVIGRDADMLSEAFAWERSYVSIEKYGCVVESRLFFRPTVEDGVILANVEKISWSAQYEVGSIGGFADGAASLYELESEEGIGGSGMIKGGDVSFNVVDEEERISDIEESDSSAGTMGDPSAAEGSSTSAGHMPGSFGLAPVVFLVMSFTGL